MAVSAVVNHHIKKYNVLMIMVHILSNQITIRAHGCLFVCLFVLLLYVSSQQLWSLRDGQFT